MTLRAGYKWRFKTTQLRRDQRRLSVCDTSSSRLRKRVTHLRREINIRASVVKQGGDSVVAIVRRNVKRREAALRRYIGIMVVL